MQNKLTQSAAKLLLVVAVLAGCQSRDSSFKGTELPEREFKDFTLTDQNGQRFTLGEQEGKVTLMFFGFTYCPDVCPLTLSTWKKVRESLTEDEAQKVEFVYITVDPERDTPEKLKAHLAVFHPDFIGLTGTQEELQPVYAGYGVYREKDQISDSATGYLVNHTASIYLLDRNGIWKLKHSNDARPEDIVHDIRLLLKY